MAGAFCRGDIESPHCWRRDLVVQHRHDLTRAAFRGQPLRQKMMEKPLLQEDHLKVRDALGPGVTQQASEGKLGYLVSTM